MFLLPLLQLGLHSPFKSKQLRADFLHIRIRGTCFMAMLHLKSGHVLQMKNSKSTQDNAKMKPLEKMQKDTVPATLEAQINEQPIRGTIVVILCEIILSQQIQPCNGFELD